MLEEQHKMFHVLIQQQNSLWMTDEIDILNEFFNIRIASHDET